MSQLPTLIRTRDRDLSAIFDLSIAVIRREPWPLLWSAALGAVPCGIISAAIYEYFAHDQSPWVGALMFVLATILLAPWAAAPLTIVLGRLMFGHKVTLRNTVKRFFQQLPAFCTFQFVRRALLFPIYPFRHAFLNEVIFLENHSPPTGNDPQRGGKKKRGDWNRCLRRSAELSKSRSDELVSLFASQIILGGVFLVGFWMASGTLISALTGDVAWEAPWLRGDLWDWRIPAGVWIIVEFFAVAKFLTYIEFRNRLEGWEIELRLKTASQTLTERRKW